jgi:hypothetical protein
MEAMSFVNEIKKYLSTENGLAFCSLTSGEMEVKGETGLSMSNWSRCYETVSAKIYY